MATKTTAVAAKTATAPAIDAATFEDIGRRFFEFVRYEREHRRISEQDPSRTISFRSEETLRLRALEARAREIPNRILDDQEKELRTPCLTPRS